MLFKKKLPVILLGIAEVGKTTLIKAIEEALNPEGRDGFPVTATVWVEKYVVKADKSTLEFIDTAGQKAFLVAVEKHLAGGKLEGDLKRYVEELLKALKKRKILPVLVIDPTNPESYSSRTLSLIKGLVGDRKVLVVINKADLVDEATLERLETLIKGSLGRIGLVHYGVVAVSALYRINMQGFFRALAGALKDLGYKVEGLVMMPVVHALIASFYEDEEHIGDLAGARLIVYYSSPFIESILKERYNKEIIGDDVFLHLFSNFLMAGVKMLTSEEKIESILKVKGRELRVVVATDKSLKAQISIIAEDRARFFTPEYLLKLLKPLWDLYKDLLEEKEGTVIKKLQEDELAKVFGGGEK